MGCDIHMYLEYSAGADPESEHESVRSWASFGGRLNPGRDYDLFSKIAGLRGGGQQLVEQRGMPENPGYHARNDNLLYISEHDPDGEGNTSMENAERYVKYGSQWVASGSNPRQWVTHPDWHSHTWLAPAEFRQVLEAERPTMPWDENKPWPIDPGWWAALAALEELERRGQRARAVIWFDN